MSQEMGETRDALALDCWRGAERIAEERKHDVKPFYIIYAGKPDPALAGADIYQQVVPGQPIFGLKVAKKASGGIRQSYRISYDRPPFILGMLVWYVNNPLGIFEFVTQLSSPPDIPLDPSLLSDRKEDQFTNVMEKGKNINVLVS